MGNTSIEKLSEISFMGNIEVILDDWVLGDEVGLLEVLHSLQGSQQDSDEHSSGDLFDFRMFILSN